MATFVIPADYLLALFDAQAYPSFLGPDWTLEKIRGHLLAQMAQGTIMAWGTGAPGNWRVAVTGRRSGERGFREHLGRIRSTGSVLYLTSYDELTAAAQFADVRLPQSGTEAWAVEAAPGGYECRVVQLYDPNRAESEEVFNQETPHFLLELTPASGKSPPATGWIPWIDAE